MRVALHAPCSRCRSFSFLPASTAAILALKFHSFRSLAAPFLSPSSPTFSPSSPYLSTPLSSLSPSSSSYSSRSAFVTNAQRVRSEDWVRTKEECGENKRNYERMIAASSLGNCLSVISGGSMLRSAGGAFPSTPSSLNRKASSSFSPSLSSSISTSLHSSTHGLLSFSTGSRIARVSPPVRAIAARRGASGCSIVGSSPRLRGSDDRRRRDERSDASPPSFSSSSPLFRLSAAFHFFHSSYGQPLPNLDSLRVRSIHEARKDAALGEAPSSDSALTEERKEEERNSVEEELPHASPSSSLHLLSGACVLPHPAKSERGGEDSFFISDALRAVGVADGVGGWIEVGVDAGLYAKELMRNVDEAVKESIKRSRESERERRNGENDSEGGGSVRGKSAVQGEGGGESGRGRGEERGGREDVAPLELSEESGGGIGAATGVWLKGGVEREGENDDGTGKGEGENGKANGRAVLDSLRILISAHAKTKSQGSSTACVVTLTDEKLSAANLGDSGFLLLRSGRVLFRTPSQQHEFNFPFQIGSEGADPPHAAQVFSLTVSPGDVLVLGTDGLFDNVFESELTAMVVHSVRAGFGPRETAENIAALARARAIDRVRFSPFAKAAQEAGFRYDGGKLDDITVVVSFVTGKKSPSSSA